MGQIGIRIKTIISLIFILLFMLILNPINAYAGHQVAISLSVKETEETSYSPGAHIPYELEINNLLGEAWVRVEIDFSNSTFDIEPTLETLDLENDWIIRGEKVYCYVTMPAHSTKHVIYSIIVPDIDELSEGGTLRVTATAEAIDSTVFTPDFTKEDPWFGRYGSGTGWTSTSEDSSGGSSSGGFSYSQVNRSTIHVYNFPQTNAMVTNGDWECISSINHTWKYKVNGVYLTEGWYYLPNSYSETGNTVSWFHFNKTGIMDTGWYKTTNGVWYHLHEVSDGDLGSLTRGWYVDSQDNYTYYFDKVTGVMLSGEQEIEGKKYNFQAASDTPQTWFYNTTIGKWFYTYILGVVPYGALLK